MVRNDMMAGMPYSTMLYDRAEIKARVGALGRELRLSYSEYDRPVVLVVLSGAVVFAMDLIRESLYPVDLDFIKASSYGVENTPSYRPVVEYAPKISFNGQRVLVVEDIIDSGATISLIKDYLNQRNARNVFVVSLFVRDTEQARKEADFTGFLVPEGKFLFGYGMDYSGHFRTLPDVWSIKQPERGVGV